MVILDLPTYDDLMKIANNKKLDLKVLSHISVMKRSVSIYKAPADQLSIKINCLQKRTGQRPNNNLISVSRMYFHDPLEKEECY